MNYYVINDNETSVALVFYDPSNNSFQFRSVIESLSIIFSNSYDDNKIKFLKKDNKLIINSGLLVDFDSWIKSLLKDTCNDKWCISDIGVITGDNISINNTISKYIGWFNSD